MTDQPKPFGLVFDPETGECIAITVVSSRSFGITRDADGYLVAYDNGVLSTTQPALRMPAPHVGPAPRQENP